MSNPSSSTTRQAPWADKKMWALGALLAVASASVVLSLNAWAGGGEGERAGGGRHGHGAHCMAEMGGMAGMHGGMGGVPLGGRHLSHLLDEADATEAQRTQIRQIADKAQADLSALRTQARQQDLHAQGLKLWAQAKVDAAAAEKLRQQVLAQHDQGSKRMLQAMIEIAQVLSPEQRAKVAKQMQALHAQKVQRMQERRMPHEPGRPASQATFGS